MADLELRNPCKFRFLGRCSDCANYESSLEEEISRLRQTVERQGWNLGGCSTLALGYNLDEKFDEGMSLPALRDVHKMALEHRSLRAEAERYRLALVIISEGVDHPEGIKGAGADWYAALDWACDIAKEALSSPKADEKGERP
jgi:hypothetical protein